MATNIKQSKFNTVDFISKWGTVLSLALLFIFFSMKMPSTFLTGSNMITIFRSFSITCVIAIGVTISLTVNGFDLSVGSSATMSGTLMMTFFIWHSMSTIPSILLGLVLTLVVALINAILIVKCKIPDTLATLSSMFIFEGVAMTYAGGGSVTENMSRLDGTPTVGTVPAVFKLLGKSPWIIIIMLLVVVVVHVFLTYTKHGRYLYVVGGNIEAARLSGIPVERYRALAYVLSALFAAVGGMMLSARVGAAQINAGAGYLMPSVAAAYIGFSVAGVGKPNAIGTFIGALLIGILENGLVMMSFPYYAINIVKGLVLALALASTYFRNKN
ncbi:ABC transporter permease [Oscillospiraceae bacterium PP1C4]